MSNRQAFIQTAVKMLKEIDPKNKSIDIWADTVTKMTKAQFEDYIERLRNGASETPDLDRPRELIPLVVPTLDDNRITVKRNLAIAKKWGHNFFERCYITDSKTGQTMLTNIPYGTFLMPIVRQAQTLEKGIAYEKDGSKLDDRTNQIADHQKGSSFSAPEVQALLSQGQEKTVMEFMKFRGGDTKAYQAMYKGLLETGEFEMSSYQDTSRVKSADVAGIYLKACHIDNDI